MSEVIDLGDNVWQCNCGEVSQFLHRSGKITCAGCGEDNGQIWMWDGVNDK